MFATADPHDPAAGGAAKLAAAGVTATAGVLDTEARALNEKFLHAASRKRPFVLLKAGITLDGKLATAGGDSR